MLILTEFILLLYLYTHLHTGELLYVATHMQDVSDKRLLIFDRVFCWIKYCLIYIRGKNLNTFKAGAVSHCQ
jgi:hypothetical protein